MEPSDFVFILDVDGTITDGSMIYTKEGKFGKVFGPDDWCFLSEIKKAMPVHFITGDKKGFPITQRRIEEECEYDLSLVPTDGLKRWEAIEKMYPGKHVIFVGDGCKDWYPLSKAYYSITTSAALNHVKQFAKYVTSHPGGERAVAEACMHVIQEFALPFPDWLPPPTLCA